MDNNYDFRIIVIDDNPEIHHDFIKILTNATPSTSKLTELNKQLFNESSINPFLPQFQIDTATQGQQGVEKIAEAIKQYKPYALAFVDIRMPPGWDGVETIQHIWQLDKDIQVVICTAYSDYTWEDTISKLGQNDNLLILKKPFDQIAIRQLACALTRKWKLMQDARSYTNSLEKNIQERTNSLQRSLSVTRATLESSADGILVVDANGNITDYNDKFISMWDIKNNKLDQMNIDLVFHDIQQQLSESNKFIEKYIELNKNLENIEMATLETKNNHIYEYYTQPHKLNDRIIGRVWSFRDITQRAKLEQELKYQATHDNLTGLPNRILLEDRIKKAILAANENNKFFAILFFDLDRFKLINDSLSHAAGDNLLRVVANQLRTITRPGDTLARMGGDEFVMLVTDIHKTDVIIDIALKGLKVINQPINIDEHNLTIETSIGISIYPMHGKNTNELLRNADAAMYLAKECGANQFQFYTENMNEENIRRSELEAELRQAITNNELILLFQPQIDIKSNQLVGVEALIRWEHPKKGMMLPIDFIPIAEDTGLIISIGEWVLRSACQQNKNWQDEGLHPIRIAVNITSQQLRQLNFVNNVKNILNETNLKPKYLELELNENAIINNCNIIKIISEIKKIGVYLALDDFGTGYSSITYLRNIPLDKLKIDRSFVKNIQSNHSDETIIQAIISMAKSLNVEVFAEGVETEKQLNILKKIECSGIQGFYFSKPLTADEFKKMLEKSFDSNNILVKED
ncbi:MAG: hypothetical protein ACD_46C00039G0011 [uncultured bacterium]|nr:MAG: hypothetical protein ACD_46C00039G0011 [uncultured bacterium]